MTFKFPCPHCGQRVAATDELIGQNVVCPTCSQNFVVHSPADLPIVEMSSVNSAPTKTHGRTPPYLWAICGTVFVLMISGGLYFWSSKKWISTSPHSASRELQKPTPNLPDLGGNQPSLIPGIPSSPEPVTPPFNGIPGLPDAPDQPAPPPAPPLHNAAGEIIFPIPESTDAAVQAKLSKIIFPGVDFRDTPLSECVDFLNHKSKELDPQRVGVSVAIDHSVPPSTTGFRLTLRLNNVPEVEVLNYVASLCGLKFRIDASGVTLLPKIDTKTGVLFQAAAEGNAIAQDKLGMMYVTGKGVPKDDAKAFEWFQKAAAQGYALAQYDLGYMYAAGRGVPKDDAKAFEWYQKAAAQGNASAQNFLGVMYASGQGVPKDDTKAFEWYLKAAEQGNSDAKNELGLERVMHFG